MGDNKHGDKHGHGGNHQGGGQGGGQGWGKDKPSDLGQKVDWMTYTHQQLWEMINTGVDLKAAGSAQADWATVGKALGEVQELLAKAISQSSQAWTGESAERAREALESVEKWALNTSEHADNVAKCIATEIDHVQTAREMMPPPAPAPPVVAPVTGAPSTPIAGQTPVATHTPVATPRSPLAGNRLAEDGGYRSPTLASHDGLAAGPTPVVRAPGAFTGIDTIAAPAIDSVVAADATHRQAAEVMAMFQQNSYEVDRTVPSFSPPTNPVAPPPPPPVVITPNPPATDGGGGGAGTGGGQAVVNNPAGPPNQRPGGTSAQFGRGGFAGGRGGYGGRGALPTPVGMGGGGGGVGPVAGPGGATGSLGAERGSANPGSVTSQFQAPKSVTPQSGMIGAAPMAAPPPVAGGGEKDRNRPGYLEDDDNVFGVDRKAAPPVIGL
ncbi:PPE domain-containing protein [Saccharothrix sp. 6-C]|uniref:PPE domain-containing protein n=1 Tax=Saccharothrix sp. 6-C TaxID=2781735 RepID=UPI001916EAC6|nr:PPE domain-containing protein [Saccharothrix sp. 6-C]QQQ76616.1 PPE domain-containing protein [Saccharothrix sp. 6-C]